jgi:hypothetical protein
LYGPVASSGYRFGKEYAPHFTAASTTTWPAGEAIPAAHREVDPSTAPHSQNESAMLTSSRRHAMLDLASTSLSDSIALSALVRALAVARTRASR